ncbi:MAG: chorismate-binding protein, partial [Bdellovibrionales bacterium]|nr:chorismate-binding protein [Bdellovibrionales bacterium]
ANGKAMLYPIAGTYRRTGDDAEDAQKVAELKQDPKENAEHVMLVDLARNDLSRFCTNVHVAKLKVIKYFSHVIHLESEVIGTLEEGTKAVDLFAATFPAGTLSGAPKYKAMELIDRYEPDARGYYGGAIGFFSFNGQDSTHAIMIRTMLSKNKHLYFQAGGGVVIDSVPATEVQEVRNKLGALRQALVSAQELSEGVCDE